MSGKDAHIHNTKIKLIMTKTLMFILLSTLAFIAAVFGTKNNPDFFDDFWYQVFWLSIGTILTVFFLESILEQADKRRRRKADAFALRTFVANMLHNLNLIMGSKSNDDDLFTAALKGDKQFAMESSKMLKTIKASKSFSLQEYEKNYLNISSGLRSLSTNHIRLFSVNEREMINQYKELNKLADQWNYISDFSEDHQKYISSLEEIRNQKELENTQKHIENTKKIIFTTAENLVKIIMKNSEGKTNFL